MNGDWRGIDRPDCRGDVTQATRTAIARVRATCYLTKPGVVQHDIGGRIRGAGSGTAGRVQQWHGIFYGKSQPFRVQRFDKTLIVNLVAASAFGGKRLSPPY